MVKIFERRKTGPVPKEINLDQVIYWAGMSATAREVAGSFHVHITTLDRRLQEHFGMGYEELSKLVDGELKLSLRRYQYNMAKTNAAMAIWLGKQWLGQKDHEQIKEIPLDKNMDFAKLYIDAESKRLDVERKYKELEERLNAIEPKTNSSLPGSNSPI